MTNNKKIIGTVDEDDSKNVFDLDVGQILTAIMVICALEILLSIWGLIALIMRQKKGNPLHSVALIFAILGLLISNVLVIIFMINSNKTPADDDDDNNDDNYDDDNDDDNDDDDDDLPSWLSPWMIFLPLLIGPIMTLILVYAVK